MRTLTLEEWSEVQALSSRVGANVTRTKEGFRCRRADIFKPFSYKRKNNTVTAQIRPDVVEELRSWMICHPQFDRRNKATGCLQRIGLDTCAGNCGRSERGHSGRVC